MAGNKESEVAQLDKSTAGFEAFGARGFASVGAAVGLALSLVLAWATAAPLPASPTHTKSRPAVQAETPAPEEVKPSVTAKQASLSSPQPLPSTPKAEAPVAANSPASVTPLPSPRPLLSEPAAERSEPEPASSPSTYGGTSESSTRTGGGTVDVRGYYRKNGTYVSPHTRRPPRPTTARSSR